MVCALRVHGHKKKVLRVGTSARKAMLAFPRVLLTDVEAHVGALYEWPYKEQRLVLAGVPPGRLHIFRFTLFLLGNGCPPRPLARLLVGAGLLPTLKARRDAWDVLRGFRSGCLKPGTWYWSMAWRAKVVLITDRPLPSSLRDPIFWHDAKVLLHENW